MKRHPFLILLCPLLFSCSKEQKVCCADPGGNIGTQAFEVVNANGEDLLNSDTEGAIDINKINLYFLVDDKKIEARDYYRQRSPSSTKAYNRPYSIHESNGKYILTIDMNNSIDEDGAISYTFIEWTEYEEDTIKGLTSAKRANHYETTMIQFNDIEVPPEERGKTFTIVK